MNTFDGYIRRDGTNSKVLLDGGDAKALSSFIGTLSYNNNKITYTKADGSTSYDLVDLSSYMYSLVAATSDNLGGIRIGFPESGKNYQVKLDSNNKAYVTVPWEANTHYTTRLYVGDGTAENKVTTNGNTRIAITDDNTVRNYITLIGSGATTVSSDDNGKITINSINTTYNTGDSTTLNTGTNTEGKLWSAKTLVDYISDILGVDSTAITSLNTLINQLHDNDTATGILVELAKKLNTPSSSIGSNSQPIYWNGSAFTTIGYTIETSVPSNAVFTDTKYSFYVGENNNTKEHKNVNNPYFKLFENNTPTSIQIKAGTGISVSSDANGNITIKNEAPDQNHNIWIAWVGATSSSDGTAGYMPAPTSAQRNQFLRGDGTWVDLNNYSLPARLAETITSDTSSATYNGFGRLSSNNPLSGFTGSGSDCMTVNTAYSSVWAGQLALDYRTSNVAYRAKNNGTWLEWAIMLTNKNSSVSKSEETLTVNLGGTSQSLSNTHYTTGLYIGATEAKSNAQTTNGNTYIKLFDDDTRRSNFKISGTQNISVSSDANGNITITGPDLSGLAVTSNYYTKSEIDNKLSSILDIKIVPTLPITDINTKTLYLMSAGSTGTNDLYKEYVYINKGTSENPNWDWETLGEVKLNYSDLVTNIGIANQQLTWSKGGVAQTAIDIDAKTLMGVSLANSRHGITWNYIPKVRGDGVMEVGKYIDFHNSSNDGIDYAVRLMCQNNNRIIVNLPTTAGTLALTSDLSNYLPLTGGTLTGHLTIKTSTYRDQLTIYRNENNNNSVINFSNKDGFLGAIGFTGLGQTGMTEKPHVVLKDGTLYTLLHSGNTSISNGTITINGTSITPLTSIGSYLPIGGGTLTGAITIKGVTDSGAYSQGGYNKAYNNIILKGDETYGVSGITFLPYAKDTSISNPSDVAFIQYHPHGVTAAAYNTTPTQASSGELGRLVIGIGNDTGSSTGEELWLQTAGANDLKHYVVNTAYTIWDSGNLTNLNQLTNGPGYLTTSSLPTRLQEYITADTLSTSTLNGFGRIISTDSPFIYLHTSNKDSMYIGTAYSSIWAGQLATDYRTNNIAYRAKNNNTWTEWANMVPSVMNTSELTDCNSVNRTGIFTNGNFTNRPSGVDNWGDLFNIRLCATNNNYHRQLFFDCYGTDRIWTRSDNAGTWTSWKELITSANIGSQSVNYATSASKLTTDAGSATQPVYFSNGVPTTCTYQLNKTVPSNAVFTDTHVTQHLTNNNVNLPILLSTSGITDVTIDATSYTIRNNSIFANPSEGTITANKFNGSATHADTSSQSGFVENHGDNLEHYWMKLWEVDTNSQSSEVDITFLLQSSYQEMQGTLHIRIRQDGKGGSTGWYFNTSMRLTSGNIDKTRVRLYYNNSTGNCQLWYNCQSRYGNINAKMLHKTSRWSNEVSTLGTMYSTGTTEQQTLPGTGYEYVEPTYAVYAEWNGIQNKPSSYPVQLKQDISTNVNYPLVWTTSATDQNGPQSALCKSFDKLLYNPSRSWLRSGTLELYPGDNTNYSEGLRIHSSTDGWTTLAFCGSDNTGTNGTSANSWQLHTYDGNFYINRNSAGGATVNRLWGHSNGYTIGHTTESGYNFTVGGTSKFIGTTTTTRILPASSNTYNIGSNAAEYANTFSREVYARHLNASGPYSADKDLYLGYNSTTNILFYVTDSAGNNRKKVAQFKQDGSATFDGTVTAASFYSSSDIRLKNIISNPIYKAEDFANLDLVKYTWKGKDDKVYLGSIAQSVEKEFSELVNTNQDGYKSLDYSVLGVVGIISLAKEIIELKEEIKKLKYKLYG